MPVYCEAFITHMFIAVLVEYFHVQLKYQCTDNELLFPQPIAVSIFCRYALHILAGKFFVSFVFTANLAVMSMRTI